MACELKVIQPKSLSDFKRIEWDNVKPFNNPTITRMLTIATGVFSTVDIAEAVITQKYWVSVNYVGLGRFTVAVGQEMAGFLNRRKIAVIKNMYETIKQNTYSETDNHIYERINNTVKIDKFGLNIEQTEILYNLEFLKTMNDIEVTKIPVIGDKIKDLKMQWIEEWKHYMTIGFSSFVQDESAVLHWYSKEELLERIKDNEPEKPWFRLTLLETMLFEPYCNNHVYPRGDRNLYRYGSQGTARGSRVQNREIEDGGMCIEDES